jgi:hypothetical protein
MMAAEWVVMLAAAYAACGLVFAAAFVTIGIARLDPAARGATWRFRLLILPGAAALWPWLARQWASRR